MLGDDTLHVGHRTTLTHSPSSSTTVMGLAEPRKRLKIAHDPRNLSWSSSASTSSVGHRLMTSQGWSEGQSLGARTPSTGTSTPTTANDDATRLAMSRVGVLFKDDTLGLGAKLKSKDVEGQKTGLDAFQGLLGRLNSKTEEDLERHERREGEKKLEGYARGRWGGMMFVPGGVLVQGEGFKSVQEGIEERRKEMERRKQGETGEKAGDAEGGTQDPAAGDQAVDEKAERRRRKEERRKRKGERRARKAVKVLRKEQDDSKSDERPAKSAKRSKSTSVSAPDEVTSSSDGEDSNTSRSAVAQPKQDQKPSVTMTETIRKEVPGNARRIIRARNIEAKRKAFSDTKGLDAIFMKS